MTSDLPDHAYVWTWLPEHPEPVVAGVLRTQGDTLTFQYGASYLARGNAISLYEPELPLTGDVQEPVEGLKVAGCLRDGSPDAWGRRVIESRMGIPENSIPELGYMLYSGSNRFGALDFQQDAATYTPRADSASLDELHKAAVLLQQGNLSNAALSEALIEGTSIGGARPKVVVHDNDGTQWIAKLSSASDIAFSVVNAEAACMYLARQVGLNVPDAKITRSLNRDVLLVRRFDREGQHRRHTVSALTMLGLDEIAARYATYPQIVDVLRRWSSTPNTDVRELFTRIIFNIAISNHDDHARNHAAFWDGKHLTLTPAFDLTPGHRTGDTAFQAMAIDRNGNRASTFATCVEAAPVYGVEPREARDIVDRVVAAIEDNWRDASNFAQLTRDDAQYLRGRQVLHSAVGRS